MLSVIHHTHVNKSYRISLEAKIAVPNFRSIVHLTIDKNIKDIKYNTLSNQNFSSQMSNFMYVHTSFINLPKRVQHCSTSVPCTQNRIITDWRKVWSFFQRCVHTTNRNNLKKIVMRFLSWVVNRNNYVECFSTHHSRSFQSTRGPNIPAKSNTITVLVLSYKVLVRSHFWKEFTTSFIKTKCFNKKLPTTFVPRRW